MAVGYAVGAAVAGFGYSALFLLLAVLTRNAVVAGQLYALIWETLIGGFVPGAQTLSIQQWALSVTERIVGPAAEQLGVVSAVGLWTAVPLLAVAPAVCLEVQAAGVAVDSHLAPDDRSLGLAANRKTRPWQPALQVSRPAAPPRG